MITDRIKYRIAIILGVLFISYTIILYSDTPTIDTTMQSVSHDGKLVWQKYNCNACHQIYGFGGYLGPDLTNIFSRRPQPAIEAFIKNGTYIMPKFDMKENEISLLMEYLKSMNETGNASPKSFIINTDGTIKQ